jgi:MFS family permease
MSESAARHPAESRYAAMRLVVAVLLMTLGASGMYVVPVALPAVQAEFGVARADASIPYSLLMIGFGIGGLLMGRLADRFGVMVPLIVGAVSIGAGFVLACNADGIWAFSIAHGVMIGLLGSSATFSPLLADTSLWWVRRRGIAVAICASGNYLGGAVWPPIVQRLIEAYGWRHTYVAMGIACTVLMLALAAFMRERPPLDTAIDTKARAGGDRSRPFGLALATALVLLMMAGIACCVAMSMPQVHIVAYCGDLGYGPARGAEMLSLMLGFGIVSRLVSGVLSDRIGGLRTLLLGSVLQGLALLLFLPFDGLVSLYVISALFGLFQGGIVPSYAIIVRENFPAARTGALVGAVIMCTLLGMALGGWMSGKIFDVTGSYHAAFWNGITWNALNLTIAFFLLRRSLQKNQG